MWPPYTICIYMCVTKWQCKVFLDLLFATKHPCKYWSYHSRTSKKHGRRLFHSKHASLRLSLHAAGQVSLCFRVVDPSLKSDIASLISMLYVVHLWPLGLWGHTDHTPLAAGEYEVWNLITFTSLEAGGAKETGSHRPVISTTIFSTCPLQYEKITIKKETVRIRYENLKQKHSPGTERVQFLWNFLSISRPCGNGF